jgi:radical SAM protein with 4Fe4S-binding SPASM domain
MKRERDRYPLRVVFWETTTACNLRCRHCRRQRMDYEAAPEELSTGEAKKWLEDLAGWCSPLVVFSGGEPLMRRDIVELAAFVAARGLRVALATNGTLIDDDVASELKRAGVRRVSVSLDGADPETHDRMRGVPGAFHSALNALRILKKVGVSTQINMTVCRRNRGEVDRVFLLAGREGIDAVHLFIFVPVGCGFSYGRDQELLPQEVENLIEWFYNRVSRGGVEGRLTCAPQYQRFLAEKGEKPLRGPSGCLGGRSVCFVSHRGDVFPCGYLPVSAGNIRARSLGEIWNSSVLFKKLRVPDNLSEPCGKCGYRELCGGCRARAYAATGNYLGGDPTCLKPKF